MERDGEMEVEGYKEGGATVVSTPYEQRNENMLQLLTNPSAKIVRREETTWKLSLGFGTGECGIGSK